MATNYPGSLDTGTEQPSPLSTTEMDDAGFEHDVVHTNHSGAIIALETKVGTGSSTAVADSVLAGTGAGASSWSTAPSLAGLTVDTDTLHVDATNNRVGIGTTSPETSLNIVAANSLGSTFTGTADGEGVRVDQSNYTSGNYVSLIEGSYNDAQTAAHVRIGAMYDGGGSNLAFGTSNSYATGITNTAMFIDSDGKVGVGTASPEKQLHVVGDALLEDASPLLVLRDSNSTTNILGNVQFKDQTDTLIGQIFMGSSDDLRIQSSQVFYVNAQGGYRVRVDSTGLRPYADNTYDCGTSTLRWDDVFATNGTIQTSDQRDKTSITDLDLGLDFINDLRPVSFVWNDRGGYNGTRKHMGFIAQEVASTLGDQASDRAVWINSPAESVKMEDGTFEDIPDRQGIRYEELIAPLVKAVQQLSARVAALEAA